jgi:hypothetical protein
MKDKCFIYYGNPCTICLDDPEVQDFEDAKRHGWMPCPFYAERSSCSPPRFGCIAVAGARMARNVLQFYTEASDHTLAMDRNFFRLRAPLPPTQVDAYIDTSEHNHRRITDPDLVVQRVWEYARAVLDLAEDERIPRRPGRFTPPEEDVLAAMRRDTEPKAGKAPRPILPRGERGLRRSEKPGRKAA